MDLEQLRTQLIAVLDQLSDINARLESLESKSKVSRYGFEAPSAGEVAEYCTERKNNVNAEHFINFYASKGWMIGKNKMKDWRAAVRTWEKKDAALDASQRTSYGPLPQPVPENKKPWACRWCESAGPKGAAWGGALCIPCSEIADQPLHTGGK